MTQRAPKPEDVDAMLRKARLLVRKYGARRYDKDRDRCERVARKLLVRYGLAGKINERFWYLAAYCLLIGKDE